MKKLSILFLAVCILALGCKNNITNNVNSNSVNAANIRAMKTIAEDGGTPDSSPEGIAAFLSGSDFQGVFATESGFVGYKIKNSKIYFIEKVDEYKDKWTEITEGISVDKSLNKLEYQTESGLQILTFDGFGYRSYYQGEQRVIYYQKTDYLDNFEGIYWNPKSDIGIYLVISSDGCVTRYGYRKNESRYRWGLYTSQVVLKGNTLTFKGADGDIYKFETLIYPDGSISKGANYVTGSLSWWLSKVDTLDLNK